MPAMDRSDRLALIALLAACGAVLLLTDLRAVWATPRVGLAGPWLVWTGFVLAGLVTARLAPRDDG